MIDARTIAVLARRHPRQVTTRDELRAAHRMLYPLVHAPLRTATIGSTRVELWVSHRRMPMLLRADVAIVPCGPDLKMVVGPAKMLRDAAANINQWEASFKAPVAPGGAVVTAGCRYHTRMTALAVIFDSERRTTPEWIASALRSAATQAAARGAAAALVPDMTECLVPQPNWLTDEQYTATAQSAAAITVSAIAAAAQSMKTFRIWAWHPLSVAAYEAEFRRLRR